MTEILSQSSIRITGDVMTREEAVNAVGQLLIEAGSVSAEYVASMHDREASVSTYMGNFLAIPHGTDVAKSEIRHSGLAVIKFEQDVDWGGKPVRFVIGIAGKGDEHLAILSNIAIIFSDMNSVERLLDATNIEDIFAEFSGVSV